MPLPAVSGLSLTLLFEARSQPVQHGIGELRPGRYRPVAEGQVGQTAESQRALRVDPDEGPAAAEMAEGAGRVARPGPVRRLPVAQLEAETPVVRLLAAEAGQDADQA